MQLSNDLIKHFGKNIIGNIEETHLSIGGIKMKNCNNTIEGITKLVYEKYKLDFARNLFSLIGSLKILGNPTALLNNIG